MRTEVIQKYETIPVTRGACLKIIACLLLLAFITTPIFAVPQLQLSSRAGAAYQAFNDSAQWIWNSSSTQNQWVAFRKSFSLSSVPSSAVTQIAADTHYWMWINGDLVVFEGGVKRGPNPNDTYFDELDIADHLQSGTNTIAILAWHIGRPGGTNTTSTYNTSGQGGLLFNATIGSTTINSDNSWNVRVHPGYIHDTSPPNQWYIPEWNVYYDARNATSMDNWTSDTYDDSSWSAATEKGAAGTSPWGALVNRTIPLHKFTGLMTYTNDSSLPDKGNGSNIIGKLPSNIHITPNLHVNAPAGLTITIQTDHYSGEEGNPMRVTYITTDGDQEFESLTWMSGEAVIYNIPSEVTILGLGYRESGYNTEFAGSFTTNDSFYNQLWTEAVRTIYVNMRDTFMDCPTRERALWWGDAAINIRGLVYAFDSDSYPLVEKSIDQLIAWRKSNGVLHSPIPGSANRELPTQMLVSILEFWDYYLQTGDDSALDNTTYQAIKDYMNLWTFDSQGLIDHRAGDWDWNDWGPNQDVRIMDNAWYYMALESTINLAHLTGNSDDVASWQSKRESIFNNFNNVLWDDTNNEYRSPGYNGATDDRGNALAVVAGLADPAYYPYITTVLEKNRNASPYTEVWVIEALYILNEPTLALNRLRTRYTTHMNDAHYTLYEFWDAESGTINHGWNGAPMALSRYALGARATSPGWANYDLLPMLGNLTSIKSVIPTAKGNLNVDISASNTSNYFISITSPSGTTGRIGVPKLNGNPTITVDGTVVFRNGIPSDSVSGLTYLRNDNDYVYFSASSGSRTFTVTNSGDLTPKPDQVVLLTPENNSSDIQLRPTLSWQPADNAENYELVISEQPDLSAPLMNPTGLTETTFQINGDLNYDQTYYWQVRGVNAHGKAVWNESWSFTTMAPSEVALGHNWPNPFSMSTLGTNIRYSLPSDSHVHLDVYDTSGRRVAVLVNKIKPAGEHAVSFDGSGLAGGVYLYRLMANGKVITRKMLMLK